MLDITSYFKSPNCVAQKQYEALRMYFLEGFTAQEVAAHFGYTYRAFTSLVTLFRKKLLLNPNDTLFFVENSPGRKVSTETANARSTVIDMRKKYYSVPEIKVALDGLGHNLSEKNIYNILHAEGFSRLPRRSKLVKQQLNKVQIEAERSTPLIFSPEGFSQRLR